MIKQSLYKAVGRALLRLNELKEVMLDIETALKNRPLSYVEDDVQLPELTPNMMMLGDNNALLVEDVHSIENSDLRKRAQYLEQCKDRLWKRWSGSRWWWAGSKSRHQREESAVA